MQNRRKFIKAGAIGAAAISFLPAVQLFAGTAKKEKTKKPDTILRFAIASDGHYAQPGTDSDKFFSDLIGWLKSEHKDNHLDMVVINGDLVHDRPDLLQKVKQTYFDKLPVPCYTVPGNHDFADAAIWKDVFGYEDNHIAEHGDIGFVFANTADVKGKYICPDKDFLKTSFEGFSNKKIVFVFLHIPPHLWMPREQNIFIECPDVITLLHSYLNIKAVFHGHDHTLDGIRYTDKLPHLFDAHFGGNWGTEYKGYRIVEVSADYTINTYQVNASKNPVINANILK